jgi:NAD(P)-dependent dehydrogenase (short-subunit alcohol dehydrogenase family)
VQASVSEPRDVQRLFAETKKAFGKLDLLVNNAGVFKFEPFEAISVAEFHRQFSINVLGPILISATPLGRLGEPKDIAAVAVFLASEESSWVTGETIRAGGGAR